MNELAKDVAIQVAALIDRYGFDLNGYVVGQLIEYWLQLYPAPWIRLATIEALYQGRYKVISIDQILNLWRRRNRAVYHFTREFEQIICHHTIYKSSSRSSGQTRSTVSTSQSVPSSKPSSTSQKSNSVQSNSVEGGSAAAPPSGSGSSEALTSNQSHLSSVSDLAFRSADEALTIESFQPLEAFSSESLEEIRQVKNGAGPFPIHQFIPDPRPSGFYQKLKAVAHNTTAISSSGRASSVPQK